MYRQVILLVFNMGRAGKISGNKKHIYVDKKEKAGVLHYSLFQNYYSAILLLFNELVRTVFIVSFHTCNRGIKSTNHTHLLESAKNMAIVIV
jgi:hypothetical protein